MSKIIQITAFSPEIHRFVCRMMQQLSNREGPSVKEFRNMLDDDNTLLFVIHDDEETPAGMASAGFYRTPSGCKVWIEDVVVDETYRGRGYGKQIIQYILDYFSDTDADSILLTSNPSRIAANQLYLALGFEKYETNVYRIRQR